MRTAHVLACHLFPPTALFDSVPVSDDPWYVFLHSGDGSVRDAVYHAMRDRVGVIFDHGVNRGLARSWNDAIHRSLTDGCDVVLLLNDDLHFVDGGHSRFLEVCGERFRADDRISLITPLGREGIFAGSPGSLVAQDFACAAFHRSLFDRVGYFDETFFPAYCEDIDFERRCTMADRHKSVVQEALVEHGRTSTLRLLTEAERTALGERMEINKAYYHRKWGRDQEFHTPFDAGGGFRIAYEDRHDPYGAGPPAADDDA